MILPRHESDLSGSAILHASATVGEMFITHKSYTNDFTQSWHEHERASIDFVLQGGGIGTYGNREVRSSPGRVEFFRDGLRHNFKSSGKGIRSMHVVIPRSVLENSEGMHTVVVEELRHTQAVGLAASILNELSTPDRSSNLVMESLTFELLDEVCTAAQQRKRRAGWLGVVRDAIHASCERSLPLSELAEVAGVSRGHLVRGFRASMGMTPGEYHRRIRLNRASEMLACGDGSIARIASAMGFVDQAHFSNAFKKYSGITPGAFRRVVSER
ncbi:MAG: helix-turn-helix transcriptional regulator [Phycisphaerales bacterium]|nr:helix-turn-helix transcriptional regulator [Phycisphaerales bacterium]